MGNVLRMGKHWGEEGGLVRQGLIKHTVKWKCFFFQANSPEDNFK